MSAPSSSVAMLRLGQLLVAACKNQDLDRIREEFAAVDKDSPYHEGARGMGSHENMMHDGKCKIANSHRDENRFCNILPFDDYLARLIESGRYVNASVVSPLEKVFIVAQGPLLHPDTREAFWSAALANDVSLLVNLAPFTRECGDYINQGPYGEIKVKVISESQYYPESTEIVNRTLEVSTNNDRRNRSVEHLQFNAWPNYGTPESVLCMVDVIKMVLQHRRERPDSTTMVNCSGGVGRSGTLVTIVSVLEHFQQEVEAGNLDKYNVDSPQPFKELVSLTIISAIETLRSQRHPWMVEGSEQYNLIYKSLLAYGEFLVSQNHES
mmetsp:Transcript_16676/g.32355  ORF Transcript_16676/g.32355 Transcript_16676/m.32355 type:complete len:325 (+) Transcript_16676:162-1136(+)